MTEDFGSSFLLNSQFAENVSDETPPLKQLLKVTNSDILLNGVNMRIDSFKTGLKELGDIVHQKSEAENLI